MSVQFLVSFCVNEPLKIYEYSFLRYILFSIPNSGYFHTMFTSNFVERTSNKVMIHEVDVASIKTILDFLYTGK